MLDQVAVIPHPSVADVIAHQIAPEVRAIDRDGVYPETGLRALGSAGAYAHHIDGGGLARAIADMATVAETCLSSAFCVWCQDALVWYLARGENPELRTRLLTAVASGAVLGGTGLSNPMKAFSGIEPLALRGKRVAGGYRVSGRLPWVSNLGPDHLFASIFALEDGRLVMALFDCADPDVRLMRNAKFVALEGTGTYTVGLRDVFVPDDAIIAEDAAAFVPRIRQGFVLLQLGMAIGLVRGVARMMREDRAGRDAAFLPPRPDAIEDRANVIMASAIRQAKTHDDPARGAFLDVLKTRLDASWLALEAAQAASLQFGARGYIEGSDINRRQREAQFVAIVTPSVKHITTELAKGP